MGTFPKVLVIAVESFSKEASNGRTLGQYFLKWPKDSIRQIFTKKMRLDLIDCQSFYLCESMLVKGFFRNSSNVGEICNGLNLADNEEAKKDFLRNKHSPTPLNALLRDWLWKFCIKQEKMMLRWASAFMPDVILVQCGKATFPFYLAMEIAKKTHSKLALYSTEGFYFFEFNYLNWRKHSLLFGLYHRRYKKIYSKYASICSLAIYNSDDLAQSFLKVFDIDTKVIFNSSRLMVTSRTASTSFLYAGNLGLGRLDELCEFAKTLEQYLPTWSLVVYGRASTEQIGRLKEAGIVYKGFVDYDALNKELVSAGILLHVESFTQTAIPNEYFKYAFSTKIADCICSGIPFLFYGPEGSAVFNYLTTNKCAFVCSTKEALIGFLNKLAKSADFLGDNLGMAKYIAEKNHDSVNNCEIMASYLRRAAKERKD